MPSAEIMKQEFGSLNYQFQPISEEFWEGDAQASIEVDFKYGDYSFVNSSGETVIKNSNWSLEARTAYLYAAQIWEQILPYCQIKISAAFIDFENDNILGSARPQVSTYLGVNNPDYNENIVYPNALKKYLNGDFIPSEEPEILSQFNSEANWYYGTDGMTPPGKIDFVSVVMHEIGHGLGFSKSVTKQGNSYQWGFNNVPLLFDMFIENSFNQNMIDFPSGSTGLTSFLTNEDLHWNSTGSYWDVFVNNPTVYDPKLYAPSVWEPGSSLTHLDREVYQGTSHSLMTPNLPAGEAYHIIGLNTRNILRDLGWWQANEASVFDLFIKDRDEDEGVVPYGYNWQADRDDSPDICVRNGQNGDIYFEHEDLDYNMSDGLVYVYVRVRNRDLLNHTSTNYILDDGGFLELYWSKASSWSSWPDNWDGTDSEVGGQIIRVPIGYVEWGGFKDFEIPWVIPSLLATDEQDPTNGTWPICLMARIVDSNIDPIGELDPERLDDDVFFNNNIAMKNVNIIDYDLLVGDNPIVYGMLAPPGKHMLIGNPTSQAQVYDIEFSSLPKLTNSLLEQAEVNVLFDEEGWDLIGKYIDKSKLIKSKQNQIVFSGENFRIENILFPPYTRIPIYVGFNFLTDKVDDEMNFKYHVRQYQSNGGDLLGGVHYKINRSDRDLFNASAGSDKEIDRDETITLIAEQLSEDAVYNWYDNEGNLIYSGVEFELSPEITKKYKLEVIALSDGHKDYDEVQVKVKPYSIESPFPNPSNSYTSIVYEVQGSNSAYIAVFNQTSTSINNYILDPVQNEIEINLSNFSVGVYTVLLMCDDIPIESKTLIIQ